MSSASAGSMMLVENTLLVQLDPLPTDAAVRELRSAVGATLVQQSPRGLVLDLAAVDLMDSYITRCVRDLAVSARLMGVPTVVCGVRPVVADTLVEMGLDLGDVPTTLSLDSALRALGGPRRAGR